MDAHWGSEARPILFGFASAGIFSLIVGRWFRRKPLRPDEARWSRRFMIGYWLLYVPFGVAALLTHYPGKWIVFGSGLVVFWAFFLFYSLCLRKLRRSRGHA